VASLLAREVGSARRSHFTILIAFSSQLQNTADTAQIGSGISDVVTLIGKRESYTDLTFDD